jgi:hypothetical protein
MPAEDLVTLRQGNFNLKFLESNFFIRTPSAEACALLTSLT